MLTSVARSRNIGAALALDSCENPEGLIRYVAQVASDHLTICMQRGDSLDDVMRSIGAEGHFEPVSGSAVLTTLETLLFVAIGKARRAPERGDIVRFDVPRGAPEIPVVTRPPVYGRMITRRKRALRGEETL